MKSSSAILLLIHCLVLLQACFHQSSRSTTIKPMPPNNTSTSEEITCSICTEDHNYECYNGGKCCQVKGESVYCSCPQNYYGLHCEQFSLESSGTKTLTFLSTLFGLFLTIFVFIILALLVLHTYKTNKRRKIAQQQHNEILERKMMLIQEDMDKMTQSEKMSRLTRLSKLIEATTRAALITYPGPHVPPPSAFPKKKGLPSISEKPATHFRRFSEPILMKPKPPPPPFVQVRKSREVAREEVFHSI